MDRKLPSLLLLVCLLVACVHVAASNKNQPTNPERDTGKADEGGSSAPQASSPASANVNVDSERVNVTEEPSEATFVRGSDQDVKEESGQELPVTAGGSEEEEGTEKTGAGSEKDGNNEEEQERYIVTHIPELPASIAKPGRLFNSSWFIMFYTSWCEHSQRAEPEFIQAIQMLADSNVTGMYIGKIDVTKHGDVAKHFKIKGTPTFAFFKFGVRYDFIEDTKAKNLYDFAVQITTSKVDRVNTTQQLTDLQSNHSIVFLLVHDEEIDADWHSVFMRLAEEKALAAKFAYTTDPDIVKEHGINRLPCVMVLKEGKAHVHKEALSGYTMSRWIQTEKFLSFPSVNESNIRTHLHPVSGRRLGILVVDGKPSERRIAQKKAIEVVKRLAISRREHVKYQFLLLEGAELAEKLLGRTVPLPTFFVYEAYTGLYYMFGIGKKGFTEETLVTFLRNITSGNLQPEGESSLLDNVIYLGQLGYALVMTMATHRPILSLVAVLSLVGAAMFYLIICCQKKRPIVAPKSSRALAKKAALKKKKKEKAEKERLAAASKSESGSEETVRKRNTRDDTGIESEEYSQSDVRTETGSGTGTQSEGESDSQVEREETKKDK